MDEIEIMKHLGNHERVVKLYEIHETRNSLYFILEYMEGGELIQRIKDKGFYNENDAVKLLQNLLLGLKYIHSKGILHRDIKPGNIMLKSIDDDLDIKIVDYGLSYDLVRMGKPWKRCGTPGFVAPEMFIGDKKKPYAEKSDVFSLGCVFYIMYITTFSTYLKAHRQVPISFKEIQKTIVVE